MEGQVVPLDDEPVVDDRSPPRYRAVPTFVKDAAGGEEEGAAVNPNLPSIQERVDSDMRVITKWEWSKELTEAGKRREVRKAVMRGFCDLLERSPLRPITPWQLKKPPAEFQYVKHGDPKVKMEAPETIDGLVPKTNYSPAQLKAMIGGRVVDRGVGGRIVERRRPKKKKIKGGLAPKVLREIAAQEGETSGSYWLPYGTVSPRTELPHGLRGSGYVLVEGLEEAEAKRERAGRKAYQERVRTIYDRNGFWEKAIELELVRCNTRGLPINTGTPLHLPTIDEHRARARAGVGVHPSGAQTYR